MKTSKKIVILASTMILAIALAMGGSYAWFTDRTVIGGSNNGFVRAGWLEIDLTFEYDGTDSIMYPGEDGYIGDLLFNLENKSDIPVLAYVDIAGAIQPWLINPEKYIVKNSSDNKNYVKKESRGLIQSAYQAFKDTFVADNNVYKSYKLEDLVARGEVEWLFNIDKAGNTWFDAETGFFWVYLKANETVKNIGFDLSLTASAGNEYQYAIFEVVVGKATAWAIQASTNVAAKAENLPNEAIALIK